MNDTINEIISFIDQCDDLPPQCYDGTVFCTCQSFLVPAIILGIILVSVTTLLPLRMLMGRK